MAEGTSPLLEEPGQKPSPIRRCLRSLGRHLIGDDGPTPSLLLIGLLAAVNFFLVGYRVGVGDQLLYMALVDRYLGLATDHPNDIYISTFVARSYTTFWLAMTPLIQLFGWEWPLFIVFVVVKFFIFRGVWALAWSLTGDRRAAWLATLFMLMNGVCFQVGQSIDINNTITRYVVLPFLLFGLKDLWQGRHIRSAALFGVAFQIHAMSAIYWLILAGVGLLFNARSLLRVTGGDGRRTWRRETLRSLGLAAVVFSLLAGPMVIWAMVAGTLPSETFGREDYEAYSRAKHSYALLSRWGTSAWLLLSLSAVLFLAAIRQMRRNRMHRWYVGSGVAVVLTLTFHFLVMDVLFHQPLYKFQTIRTVYLLGLLAMLGAARVISAHGGRYGGVIGALVATMFLLATVTPGVNYIHYLLAVVLVLILAMERPRFWISLPAMAIVTTFLSVEYLGPFDGNGGLGTSVWTREAIQLLAVGFALACGLFYADLLPWRGMRIPVTGLCVAGLALVVLFQALGVDRRQPFTWSRAWESLPGRSHIDWPGEALNNDWTQLQLWARDHTPPHTMFFVPPDRNGFRVFSRRSAFFEYFDTEPGIFQPAYAEAMRERMEAFNFWPPSPRALRTASRTYHRTSARRWQELSERYGADYLITDQTIQMPFEPLHQQGPFTLWRIGEGPSSPSAPPQTPQN